MKVAKHIELLKDRNDYRQTLIYRRNAIDVKLDRVEKQIAKLKDGKSAKE